ncbi:MAG: Elongation factor P [Parcubacteria group bacterium GW2011_GWA2_53_21]|nr:MAG: Elongation factor P [Parcubacteria group bacterium GW2011_GWA2_53_21]
MAVTTSDIRKGAVIRHNGNLYVVVEFQHVNPGKGAAFTRTRMKDLASGKVIEITYKSGEAVDIVSVAFQTMQYLYKTGDEDRPVSLELPKKVQYRVAEAPPAVKGDTASGNVTKEIVLDNGLRVQAPIFIKEGEEILVNTETGQYSARA